MRKSIYEMICENITEEGVLREDFALPQEDDSAVRWAPGAQDGVILYHMGMEGVDAAAGKQMARALKQAASGNYPETDALSLNNT